jgi:predicted Zn-dependent protease with MMP-like domain
MNKRIRELINQKQEIEKLLQEEYEKCEHKFRHGEVLGDVVVFCEHCNRNADEIFKGMSYELQERLVK